MSAAWRRCRSAKLRSAIPFVLVLDLCSWPGINTGYGHPCITRPWYPKMFKRVVHGNKLRLNLDTSAPTPSVTINHKNYSVQRYPLTNETPDAVFDDIHHVIIWAFQHVSITSVQFFIWLTHWYCTGRQGLTFLRGVGITVKGFAHHFEWHMVAELVLDFPQWEIRLNTYYMCTLRWPIMACSSDQQRVSKNCKPT